MLWVKDQYENEWIEVKNSIRIEHRYANDIARAFGYLDYGVYINDRFAGKYSSEEKAKKVVNDIIKHDNFSSKYGVLRIQMPKDEEVE